MKKKILALLLLGMLALTALSACEIFGGSFGGGNSGEHTHSFGEWELVEAPDCENEGSEQRSCECGQMETRVVAALGHDWDEWETVEAATCETDGLNRRKCLKCTKTETKKVDALGHDWDNGVITSPPDCEHAGEKLFTCNRNSAHTKTETVPATGHSYQTWVTQTEATCTSAGMRYAVCTVCRERTEQVIPALGHSTVTQPAVEATCTSPGKTKGSYCSRCNTVFEQQTEIKALGHDYKNGVCARCGEEKFTENLQFAENGSAYTLTGIGSATEKEINIPKTHLGKPVTKIAAHAFANSSVTGVKVPDSVTEIENGAFTDCGSLKSINLPFVGNKGYSSSTTPSEQSLFGYIFGSAAYSGGVSITQKFKQQSSGERTFYIPSGLTSVTIRGGAVLYGAMMNCSRVTELVIGEGVSYMGQYAFAYMRNLERLEYRAREVSIQNPDYNYIFAYAGTNGSGIDCVIGKEVKSIPSYLFVPHAMIDDDYTVNMTTVTFEPEGNLTSVGRFAFNYITSLTRVNISDIESWCKISFAEEESNPIYYAKKLYINGNEATTLTIPDSVQTIHDFAFVNLRSAKTLNIGKGVTKIGKEAFAFMREVETLNFNAESCANFGSSDYVFEGMGTNGTGVKMTVGASATRLPAFMFNFSTVYDSYKPNLVSVAFASGSQCRTIGRLAFSGVSALTSVDFNGLTGWKANNKTLNAGDLADKSIAAKYLKATYNGTNNCQWEWTR